MILPKQFDLDRAIVYDIEADNLLDSVTKVHCICWSEYNSNKVNTSYSVDEFYSSIPNNTTTLIGHNSLGFDSIVLDKFATTKRSFTHVDTLVLSQMISPYRSSHSLESYAEEEGIAKITNEDWSTLTPNMLDRCINDVKLTKSILISLLKKASTFNVDWSESILLEHSIATEVGLQSLRGCPINKELLYKRVDQLENLIKELAQNVKQVLGTSTKNLGTHQAPFKKTGGYKSFVESYWGSKEEASVVSGAYSMVSFEPITLSQYAKVKEVLIALGWTPTQYTEKGVPKLPKGSEWDEIATLYPNSGLAALAHYGSLNNRLNILKGWVDRLRPDGRISHGAMTCGTPTGRFTHITIANLPKVTAKDGKLIYYPDKQNPIFGTEVRELVWSDRPDYMMVGWDLSAIELRMLAHYMNDKEFIDVVLNGDVHSFFWKKVTHLVATRNDWKTTFYALNGACKTF